MTLVFVHGCGETSGFWDAVRAALPDTPTLAVDLPGRPPTGGDALDSAAAAAAWLHHRIADVERPVVIGHSFGGGIAIEYALTHEVAGLGLVSSGARLRVLPAVLHLVDEAARTGVPADLSAFLHARSSSAAPPAATARDWHACNRFDRMDDVHRIAAPTLVVGGTADPMTRPKYAHYLVERIPNARLELIDGAGHMLPLEHPERLAALLRSAWRDPGASLGEAAGGGGQGA